MVNYTNSPIMTIEKTHETSRIFKNEYHIANIAEIMYHVTAL